MKTKLFGYFLGLLVCLLLVAPSVLAQVDIQGTLVNTGEGIYGPGETPSDDLPVIIGRIINIILSFLGVVMVIMIIIGGFKYMTAGGEKDGVEQGKKYLTNAIIGLVIILAAYGITNFVVSRLTEATGTAGR